MVPSAPITVSRLSPADRDDYLAFFDHERGPAFADNADWARCYCQFYRLPRAIDWSALTAAQNRVAVGSAIDCGEAGGYLARADGAVVGWLNAQPRNKLPHAFERMGVPAPPIDVPPHDAAIVVCFVVAPAWRRHGVAAALLDFALADFAARGIRVVDAFPFKADGDAPADHYHGPAALFAARGFAPIAEHENLDVVRRALVVVDGGTPAA